MRKRTLPGLIVLFVLGLAFRLWAQGIVPIFSSRLLVSVA